MHSSAQEPARRGFSFYKSQHLEEPSLHDTYHAVAALHLLGAAIPRAAKVAGFLARFPAAGAHQIYYCAFALDILGQPSLISDERRAAVGAMQFATPRSRAETSPWLARAVRIARLKKRFTSLGNCASVVETVQGLRMDGSYGDPPNFQDTYLCAKLLATLGALPADGAAQRFVDRLQVSSFSFTSTLSSMNANLDAIHARVQCCTLLGCAVRHQTDILAFVLARQTADGGFSRAPSALPDIEQTHRALQIMTALPGRTA